MSQPATRKTLADVQRGNAATRLPNITPSTLPQTGEWRGGDGTSITTTPDAGKAVRENAEHVGLGRYRIHHEPLKMPR